MINFNQTILRVKFLRHTITGRRPCWITDSTGARTVAYRKKKKPRITYHTIPRQPRIKIDHINLAARAAFLLFFHVFIVFIITHALVVVARTMGVL